MQKLRKKLELVLNGGSVRRYHTVPTVHPETVAAHSYLVAWCCAMLCEGVFVCTAQLLLAALQHDIAEHVTGDLPAPTKRKLGISAQFASYEETVLKDHEHLDHATSLTVNERRILKLADGCGGLLYCIQERRIGNRNVETAFNNFRSYVEASIETPHDQSFINLIDKMWEEARV